MPDQMYLGNLDEFINDENKVVTYKWLSSTLKVHVNQAKQMLYSFIQDQRKKNGDAINVTYFVSGVKNGNGCMTCRCAVVPEERLESYKKTLSSLTSCHIYSVQKSKLKNCNALYITDYQEIKKDILQSNKFSAIQYDRAKARSAKEVNKLRALHMGGGDADKTVEHKGSNGVSINQNLPNKNEVTKKANKGGIAGMFANATKKQENKGSVKEEKDAPPMVKTEEKSKSKPGTVSDLFSKQRGKTTEKTSTATDKKIEEKIKVEPNVNKPSKKKKLAESDSDNQKSKRRRIKEDLFDSSSDEEAEMEESPVPSPVREPSPCPESPIPEPEEEKVKSPEKKSPDVSHKAVSGEKKRRRKRKLVPKTYMDEEGFMVTEKVWESESTDASDKEVEKTETTKESPKPKSPAKLPPGKKPASKKKSPVKASGKQTSMMSFFQKK